MKNLVSSHSPANASADLTTDNSTRDCNTTRHDVYGVTAKRAAGRTKNAAVILLFVLAVGTLASADPSKGYTVKIDPGTSKKDDSNGGGKDAEGPADFTITITY